MRKYKSRKFDDLTGQKFDKWTVISRADNNKHHQVMWLCRCECGTERIIQRQGLFRENNTHTPLSCGCATRACKPRRPPGFVGRRTYLSSYKNGAAWRGLEWSLTDEQTLAVAIKDCHYCGAPPARKSTDITPNASVRTKENGLFISNGIDRVNNSKGYVLDNVVPCCFICNRSKWALSEEEWKAWMSRFVAYQTLGIK